MSFPVLKTEIIHLCFVSENVGKLKNLEYLNIALNNIERIENLEGQILKKAILPFHIRTLKLWLCVKEGGNH